MPKKKGDGVKFLPKNDEQREFIKSIEEYPLTVCRSRKYGSGKTYCAIGYACKLLKNGDIKRIVFCRDSTEVSDRLGFMPGTRSQKIAEGLKFAEAYFKLFLGREIQVHSDDIEYRDVADLAGETFCDAIMILDEAANCSKDDIEMFLSRAGHGTKCIILGNDAQMQQRMSGFHQLFVKLVNNRHVGLVELKQVLRNGWMAEVLDDLAS